VKAPTASARSNSRSGSSRSAPRQNARQMCSVAGRVAARRVCVNDRAGRGWSDPADRPLDGAQTAADFNTLLDRAHVPGPYVLAGHSVGGLYILAFAAHDSDEVACMVLLDSTSPDCSAPASSTYTGSYDLAGRFSALLPAPAHGVARLVGQDSYLRQPAFPVSGRSTRQRRARPPREKLPRRAERVSQRDAAGSVDGQLRR
jgi:pimeloyl-ACP methyl ester carboxylesterase